MSVSNELNMNLQITLLVLIVCLVLGWFSVIGCSSDSTDDDMQPKPPRVIAVSPNPGAQRSAPAELYTVTQEFRISFSQPIIPNSGRIVFGSYAPIQLQETQATDTITWNQCFRQLVLEPDGIGSMVIRDFQNINGDVQPHPYVGWYWMPFIDPYHARVLEYYPIGQEVDPETTRFIRLVFEEPIGKVSCEITPAIKLGLAQIENDAIKSCTGIVTWEIVGGDQLEYSTKYDVKIEADDFAGLSAFDYSFSTRAAPF